MFTVREFASLPSTNEYVREHAAELRHGDVIVAKTQTRGKGRTGRAWLSGEGGLYFTLCLKPARTVPPAAMAQLLTEVICRAIERTGVDAKVEQPNVVLVHGAEIAGVFEEVIPAKESCETLCIALSAGINCNQKKVTIPGVKTTTLAREGVIANENRFLKTILRCFFKAYTYIIDKKIPLSYKDDMKRTILLGEDAPVGISTGIRHGISLRGDRSGREMPGLEETSARGVRMGGIA